MKKIKSISVLLLFILVLAGCDNSVKRANNALGLMQENVTKIVNELYEVQDLENQLQADFEGDLSNAGESLAYFNSDETLVIQNATSRQEHLKLMKEAMEELKKLNPELLNSKNNQHLPSGDFERITAMIEDMEIDLLTYIEDYQQNIALEKQTFKAIANPNTDFETFSTVFSNINKLSETNLYNLDVLLKHFEPINRLLVDTKIKVVTLIEGN